MRGLLQAGRACVVGYGSITALAGSAALFVDMGFCGRVHHRAGGLCRATRRALSRALGPSPRGRELRCSSQGHGLAVGVIAAWAGCAISKDVLCTRHAVHRRICGVVLEAFESADSNVRHRCVGSSTLGSIQRPCGGSSPLQRDLPTQWGAMLSAVTVHRRVNGVRMVFL